MSLRVVQPLDPSAAQQADRLVYLVYQHYPRPNPLYDAAGQRQPIDPESDAHDRVRQLWLNAYRLNGGHMEPVPPIRTRPEEDCEHCPGNDPAPEDFLFDFHWIPGREQTRDLSLTLFTDDEGPSYRQSHRLDEAGAVTDLGDGYLRVRFTDILPGRSYAMEVAPGPSYPAGEASAPYLTFKGVILPRQGRFSRLRHDVFEEGLDALELSPPEERLQETSGSDDWLMLTGRAANADEPEDEAPQDAAERTD
jgi:hypothetical protein